MSHFFPRTVLVYVPCLTRLNLVLLSLSKAPQFWIIMYMVPLTLPPILYHFISDHPFRETNP